MLMNCVALRESLACEGGTGDAVRNSSFVEVLSLIRQAENAGTVKQFNLSFNMMG